MRPFPACRVLAALLVATVAGLLPATAQAPAPAPTTPKPPQRAVLVTGASSGIGRSTTDLLAREGFFVYATARKPEDLQALGQLANVQALALDVTKPEQIAAAVAEVRRAGRGLHGLVCNAGIAVMGPLLELRENDLLQQLDVNVLGVWRTVQAFAPLVLESKGRIAITGSLSGTVNWAFGGPYTMSKHAIEAFTDVLALELRDFGVQVAVVEPGNYRSEIMAGMRERLVAGGYGGEGSRYRAAIARLVAQPTDRAQYPEPDDVAAAFLHALRDEHPKRRYLVVPNRREAELTLRAALARVAQLNQDHPHQVDRDTLVRWLDEALQAK